jgi:hypothetical protein
MMGHALAVPALTPHYVQSAELAPGGQFAAELARRLPLSGEKNQWQLGRCFG